MAQTANFFAPGFDEQVEQQNIERQRKMAELLRQQSAEMPQGSMVSGHYVAPSFTQGLAKMLQAYNARAYDQDSNEKQKQLAEAIRTRTQDELGTFTKLLQGEAARDIQPLTPNDDDGNPMPVVHKDAVPGDLNAAYQYAAKAYTPALQQLGTQSALSTAQEQAKLAQAEALRKQYNSILATPGMTAQKALAMGVPEANVKAYYEAPNLGKTKGVVINGQLVNEYDGTPIGKVVPKQADAPNPAQDLLVPDPNNPGKMIPNTTLVGVKKEIASAGAARNSTVVNQAAPENEYNKTVGKTLADNGTALVSTAQSAPETVRTAKAIRDALDRGAITGTGANLRYGVQKALETAGLIGAGKAASTEELMSGLGKITLSGVKTSGLGAGNGFTDKDKAFLESAISGQIEATPENLRRVADVAERVARANHAKGTKVLERWKLTPALANVAQDTTIDPLPDSAPTPKPAAKGKPTVSNW